MADDKPDPKAGKVIKIELKIDEKLAGGEYANICVVNHTDAEFVLDTFFLQPGRPRATMKGRTVLSPKNAKRLFPDASGPGRPLREALRQHRHRPLRTAGFVSPLILPLVRAIPYIA
ncbi:MAG: DUF3467 domain-containing protein [Deltaproteobacteria bacterium]|nr:DUF3467 domain-containing protein [Deltaproteobacteria bacterium]